MLLASSFVHGIIRERAEELQFQGNSISYPYEEC
jgi:hypothetical protein